MGMIAKMGEMYVKLGFQADNTKLRDFANGIADLNLSSVLAGLGLAGLYDITKKLMDVADQNAMRMNAFSLSTGYSAQKMQQWSTYAEEMGVSAGDVEASVKSLEDRVALMKFTGEGSQAFMKLGIDPLQAKDSFDLMQMIGKALERLDPATQRLATHELGLSDNILVLIKAMQKYPELFKEGIKNTDQQTEALVKNHAAWARVRKEWGVVLEDVGAKLAPFFSAIAKGLDYIIVWIDKLPWLQNLLIGLGVYIGIVTTLFTAFAIAAKAAAFASWLIGLSPGAIFVTLLAAAVLAFGIAIKLAVEHWDELKRELMAGLAPIIKAFEWIKDLIDRIVEGIKSIGGFLGRHIPGFGEGGIVPGSRGSIMAQSLVAQPAMSTTHEGNRSQSNKFDFHITGSNAEDIASQVNEKIKGIFGDAEYQSPVEYK